MKSLDISSTLKTIGGHISKNKSNICRGTGIALCVAATGSAIWATIKAMKKVDGEDLTKAEKFKAIWYYYIPCSWYRYTFDYQNPIAGEGRFIHTYMQDGNPLPSFEGEPELVELEGDIDSFTKTVWENLNEENKVSLFVRYINIETGKTETKIVNKNC